MSQAIELNAPTPVPTPAIRWPTGLGQRLRWFLTGVRSVFDLGPRRYTVGRYRSAADSIGADLRTVLGDFQTARDAVAKGRTTDGPRPGI